MAVPKKAVEASIAPQGVPECPEASDTGKRRVRIANIPPEPLAIVDSASAAAVLPLAALLEEIGDRLADEGNALMLKEEDH